MATYLGESEASFWFVVISESPAMWLREQNYLNETLEHHLVVMNELIQRDKNRPPDGTVDGLFSMQSLMSTERSFSSENWYGIMLISWSNSHLRHSTEIKKGCLLASGSQKLQLGLSGKGIWHLQSNKITILISADYNMNNCYCNIKEFTTKWLNFIAKVFITVT